MSKTAILYFRVSTEQQAREGVSLAAQGDRARAWCVANGYTVGGEYQDAGITGSRMDIRDGLKDALDHVTRSTGSALVVYSLSRLSRSLRDTVTIGEQLNAAGCDLVSLSESLDTTSAGGRMIFHVFAAFSQFERDLVSERTRMALAHKRQNGEKTGGTVPFGYDVTEDGRLTLNPEEQEAISLVSSLRAKRYTLRAICRELTARAITTKTGAKWHPYMISLILQRAA